jgi:hypothetical protein
MSSELNLNEHLQKIAAIAHAISRARIHSLPGSQVKNSPSVGDMLQMYRELFDAINGGELAALREDEPDPLVVRWRPIEEAPQDGTEILVAFPGHDSRIVYWSDCGWYDGDGGQWSPRAFTHWIPLPRIEGECDD